MQVFLVSSITIVKRQRRSMNPRALADLASDIKHRGLLHAPVVRLSTEGTPILVAGERRLTAIKALGTEGIGIRFNLTDYSPGQVPCVLLSDGGEIGNRESELAENIFREDLSWQDKVAAIDELHRLRLAQNPQQTQKDTAEEISQAQAGARGSIVKQVENKLSRASVIAQHLDDPDVQRASTEAEAFKIVQTKTEALFRAELARQTPSAPSEHTLLQGDFRQRLLEPNISSSKYTCIIADPPYGVGADNFGDAATLGHAYKDTPEEALALADWLFSNLDRVAADQAHFYLFCSLSHFNTLQLMAGACSWKALPTPIIWSKGSQGHVPDGVVGWRRTYECILFASRGDKRISRISNDVLPFTPESDKLHAAQKPTDLYKHLLSLSCLPGESVLDPCCGSGTIFRAAHALRLKATGIELDERYHKYASATLASLTSLAKPLSPAEHLASI